MVYQRSSLRYAHTAGHTGLVYTNDSSYIVTCGSDGDIRLWKGIDDDDPTSSCLGEFVICVAHDGKQLFASTDRNTVQAYTFPSMDNDGVLLRFTASVTCLQTHNKYIAAGSEDTTIKVLKRGVEKAGEAEIHLLGHNGPVLALDICSNGELLASVAGDGQLKIWNLETGKEVKTFGGLMKTNSFESTVCYGTPAFEPNQSKSLAYVKGKEVVVLNTTTWEVQFTLSDERTTADYTCCKFSSDGQLLAAGTTAGEISVFDFVRKQTIKCESPSSDCKTITCLAWHTVNNNELAFCDETGQLGTIFSENETATANDDATSVFDAKGDKVDFGDIDFAGDDNMSEDRDGAIYMDDAAVDDDDDGISIEKLKSRVMKSSAAYANGDEDSKGSMPTSVHDSEAMAGASSSLAPFVPKMFKQQRAFQPSATPVHLEHRYLVWNEIGLVSAHADSADGAIDVEFHDASVHHSLHIANYNNHNMASLSVNVLALAAEGATKLVCIALAASGNREWSIQLPDCESVEAIAASSKIVAVSTNMHFLRLFTVMGTQREIISIPGPVIAMAAHEDRLIVCFHCAPSSENQQNIAGMLIQTHGMQLRTQNLAIPLPANRQMTWLGFSDCGSPVFGDSMGLLQLYSLKSNLWYPICDTMKHSQSVSNNYFIIAISERSQIVQAVLCRGTSYPMTNPRPMIQELPMQSPICDSDTEKSDLEDTLVRASIMTVDNADKIVKETAIKLFALACRSEIEMRAKELIETIACTDLLQLAVKYATKLGRIHLSDRLSELLPQLEEQREKSDLNEFEMHPSVPQYSPFAQSHSNHSSSSTSAKLAPKSMELTLAKRASLKRFSLNNNSTNMNTISKISSQTLTETQNTESSIDTQENVYDHGTENAGETLKDLPRSPLNSVNPFASKRKLADVDFVNKSSLFQGKLKIAKK